MTSGLVFTAGFVCGAASVGLTLAGAAVFLWRHLPLPNWDGSHDNDLPPGRREVVSSSRPTLGSPALGRDPRHAGSALHRFRSTRPSAGHLSLVVCNDEGEAVCNSSTIRGDSIHGFRATRDDSQRVRTLGSIPDGRPAA